MKIALDISPLRSGHKNRGIGIYVGNLLNNLKQIDGVEVQEFEDVSGIENVDVIHMPYFDLFKHTLPINKKLPFVVTIHDVAPLVLSSDYPKGIRGLINFQLQKLALGNVSTVITDSVASKEDIHKFLKVSKDNITSIHLAPSEEFRVVNDQKRLNSVRKKYNLPDEFALYTGNVNPNKNLLSLAEGCKIANIPLVLVGADFDRQHDFNHPELKSYREFLRLYKDDLQIKIVGYVVLEDLICMMNLATVLLLASLYEGFGLPILEAQSCGCPVITSNIASMPEISGGGAILVNPKSSNDIAEAVVIMRDNIRRQELIKKGFNNVKDFNWKKTVLETVEVYKEVANK